MSGSNADTSFVVFKPATGTFVFPLPEYHDQAEYEVPLGDRPTAREICRWLAHLREKEWVTIERLGYFVHALNCVYNLRDLE